MVLAHHVGENHLHVRQARTGSWFPAPNGPARAMSPARDALAPAGETTASTRGKPPAAETSACLRELRRQEGAKRFALFGAQRETGRHRVAAARFQCSRLARRADDGADIDARHRTRRAAPQPAFEPRHKGRLGETFFEPAGHDADDAGMPALARQEQERRIVLHRCLGHRLVEDEFLDRLPFAIVGVERASKFLCVCRVRRRQEIDAKAAASDAPARVDPRPEDKPQMIRRERRRDACDGSERGKARPLQFREPGQARLDESAIDADERHDVANRRQPDEIELIAQIGFAPARVPARVAQCAVQRDEKQKHDPSRTDMPEPGPIAGLVGIDVRHGRRLALDRVMVEYDDVKAGVARGRERIECARPAIDGDDQARAFLLQLQQGGPRSGP